MKKILLVAIILFTSISRGFAFTHGEELYGYDEYIGKSININAYCYELELNVNWHGSTEYAYGHISCGDVGANIADYTWNYDGTSPSGQYQVRKVGQYYGTVILYLEAYRCYGHAYLRWTI